MIAREMMITVLCLLSVIGGSAATTSAWIDGRPPVAPAPVAQMTPEALTAWVTAIANAIPVLAASIMLAWGSYRSKRREIHAADQAALADQLAAKSGEVEALKSTNQRLAARLDDAEHAAKRPGPSVFRVDLDADE